MLKSAKGAVRTVRRTGNLPAAQFVLREFLRSAQAAERGPKPKEELPDWPPRGESVVREFLKSAAPA